jgi:pentapeptide MXKDX repeat protein
MEIEMTFMKRAELACALAASFLLPGTLLAQDKMKDDSMKEDSMKQDSVKQDKMDDKMMHEEQAKTLFTGKFHGKVHKTAGRATVYQDKDGKQILRLTNFKTSNGPDVHVILMAVQDPADDANSLKSSTERVELGKLKGNEGDQNYDIPAGTDLNKFQTVSIYCVRFNANFGSAPLAKF